MLTIILTHYIVCFTLYQYLHTKYLIYLLIWGVWFLYNSYNSNWQVEKLVYKLGTTTFFSLQIRIYFFFLIINCILIINYFLRIIQFVLIDVPVRSVSTTCAPQCSTSYPQHITTTWGTTCLVDYVHTCCVCMMWVTVACVVEHMLWVYVVGNCYPCCGAHVHECCPQHAPHNLLFTTCTPQYSTGDPQHEPAT